MLERCRCRQQGSGEVGGGITEIVAGRRFQEPLKGGMIGRERQLQKGAPAEDDQSQTISRSRLHRRQHCRFCGSQPGQWKAVGLSDIGGVHRAGKVESHQNVPPSMRQRGGLAAELGPGKRKQAERHRRNAQAQPQSAPSGSGQSGRVGQQLLVAKPFECVTSLPLRARQQPPGKQEEAGRQAYKHRLTEAQRIHGSDRNQVAPATSSSASRSTPGMTNQG